MARRRYWKLSTGKEAYNILIMPPSAKQVLMVREFVQRHPAIIHNRRVGEWIANNRELITTTLKEDYFK